MSETPQRGETTKRYVTGTLLSLYLILALWVQGALLAASIMLLTAIAMMEVYGAFKHTGIHTPDWMAAFFPLVMLASYALMGAGMLFPATLFCLMISMIWVVAGKKPDMTALLASVFPIVFPGQMLFLVLPLMDLATPELSTLALVMGFVVAFSGDIAGYQVGRKWGKRPLAPEISPKKTVEGAVAGLVGSTLAGVAAGLASHFWHIGPPLWHLALLGLLGGFAEQCGDLTASVIKRSCHLKDYGSIFPGHGGVVDRLDGCFFCMAVVYIYFVGLAGVAG